MVVRPGCGEAVLRRPSAPGLPTKGRTPDPERAEREAVRRAQATVRRLVTEHRLVRMWTLTLREATTAEQRGEVLRLVQLFVKRVHRRLPGLKYVAVLEWHPGGHGWHVHMVVNRFVPKRLVGELWGHGFVDTRLIRPRGDATEVAGARKAAAYVAKYLGKGEGEHTQPPHERGAQRYLRSEGLDIVELLGEGHFSDLLRWAWESFPQGVSWVWWSGNEHTWRGPPCLVLRAR